MLGNATVEAEAFEQLGGLNLDVANAMIENAVGAFSLPLGVGLNLQVNGQDYIVPMAIEEPSVIAAVSFAARIVREAGGFSAEADESIMFGQVQVTGVPDVSVAAEKIQAAEEDILALANHLHPQMVQRGGGAKAVEVRILPAPEGPEGEPLLIVHLVVDTMEAMGANLINTMAEGVAPLIETVSAGRVYLRILSNLADRRLARAKCRIPLKSLADFGVSGQEIAYGIVQADRFAQADVYRATTHNKGIMNGIDAVALATGQDWRAIEAGAHAFAARTGQYKPLSRWAIEDAHLVGSLELPLQLGLVGGASKVHPGAQSCLEILKVKTVKELACVMASVGLAQNFAAVRALGSVGIQKGHMALHARSVAVLAGARGEWVEKVAERLVGLGQVKVDKAREILAAIARDAS